MCFHISLSFNVCHLSWGLLCLWYTMLLLILFACHHELTFSKSIGEIGKEKIMYAFLKENELWIKERHTCTSEITCVFLTSLYPELLQPLIKFCRDMKNCSVHALVMTKVVKLKCPAFCFCKSLCVNITSLPLSVKEVRV